MLVKRLHVLIRTFHPLESNSKIISIITKETSFVKI